jgi:hypothetical protein
MRRYALQIRGSAANKLYVGVWFTVACFSLIFLPAGLILLIEEIEIVEQ